MKIITSTLLIFLVAAFNAQISPSASPYNADGPYNVVADSIETVSPNVLWYRPQTLGAYPVFIFQPGANGFFSSEINRHSYDLYLQHLASWGYVVMVVDETSAGLPNGNGFTTVYDWFLNEYSNGGWQADYCDTSKIAIGGHSNGGVNATNVLINNPSNVKAMVYMASYPSDNFLLPHDVSNYSGFVLSMSGSEDTDSEPATCKVGYDGFTSASCGVYLEIDGMGHGGFGDYDNSSQPVGTLGRADATSTVKHYLVSFLEYALKGSTTAEFDLLLPTNRLDSESEFESSCVANTSSVEENYFQANVLNSSKSIIISTKGNIRLYELYNIQGQIIKTGFVNSNSLEILKTEFNSGAYLVKLTNDKNSTIVKLILD